MQYHRAYLVFEFLGTVLKNYLPEFKFFNISKNPTLAQSFKYAAQRLLKNENKVYNLPGGFFRRMFSQKIRRKMKGKPNE